MRKYPKTHSKILWHFTGGPQWSNARQQQLKTLKSQSEAFDAFLSILKTATLRVGSYHEHIKCIVPREHYYNSQKKRMDVRKNSMHIISTSPVCCVADIPLTELFHHAKRYGKIAIGFKRNSLIKAGFNPVFYTLHNTDIILNFLNAQNTLEQSDFGIDGIISDISDSISEIECGHSCTSGENEWEPDETYCTHDIDTSELSSAADEMQSYIADALADLKNTLAFVKTFDKSQFDTIYSEREWRSTSSFKFHSEDIAALILPEKNDYYKKFIDKHLPRLKLPSSISIHTWEDIK